jgi:hypothetical protein
MKPETRPALTPWYLAAIAPIAVAGCSGTMLGHVAVLALTLGIFFGTLSLGRARPVGGAPEPTAPAQLTQGAVDHPVDGRV